MKKYFIIGILVIIFLTGCSNNTQGTFFENSDIQANVKDKIDQVMEDTITKIKEKRFNEIERYNAQNNFGTMNSEMFNQICSFLEPVLNKEEIELIEEYYGVSENIQNHYVIGFKYDSSYILNLRIDGETYIRFYSLKYDSDEYIVMFNLKKDNTWKLSSVDFGIYRLYGKTSTQWNEEGKNLEASGYRLPAVVRYMFAYNTVRLPYLKHSKVEEITDNVQLQNEMIENQEIPIVIDEIYGNPEIHTVQLSYNNEDNKIGYIIGYLTKKTDSEFTEQAIKEEANLIHQYLIENNIVDELDHMMYVSHRELPIGFYMFEKDPNIIPITIQ